MAKNPFHQLAVIKNASLKGKMIVDCYRLLFKEELWLEATHVIWGRNNPQRTERIRPIWEKVIHLLRTNRFHKNQWCTLYEKDCAYRLVREVTRNILASVYPYLPPSRQDSGFVREVHATLRSMQKSWGAVTWCMVGCLDESTVEPNFIQSILKKKIDDHRFLLLIHHLLITKTKNQEKWTNLLYRVYLLEVDKHMTELSGDLAHYVRLSNQFIIGINGSKQQLNKLRIQVLQSFRQHHHLQLKHNKIIVRHIDRGVNFQEYKLSRKMLKTSLFSPRSILQLSIPTEKIRKISLENQYGNIDTLTANHRSRLINLSEETIHRIYKKELTQFFNYYELANDYKSKRKLLYLANKSFIATIAHKRKISFKKSKFRMMKNKQGTLLYIMSKKITM